MISTPVCIFPGDFLIFYWVCGPRYCTRQMQGAEGRREKETNESVRYGKRQKTRIYRQKM